MQLAKSAMRVMSSFARSRCAREVCSLLSIQVGAVCPLPYVSPTLIAAKSPRQWRHMAAGKWLACPCALMKSYARTTASEYLSLVGWPARTANMRPVLLTRGQASLAKNQDTVNGKKEDAYMPFQRMSWNPSTMSSVMLRCFLLLYFSSLPSTFAAYAPCAVGRLAVSNAGAMTGSAGWTWSQMVDSLGA